MSESMRSAFAAIVVAAILAIPSIAAAASWDWARTTATVNLRAGPSVAYPRIATLPEGARVRLHGCLRHWSWCDISWRRLRGWVSGRYLTVDFEGRRRYVPDVGVYIGLPFIVFDRGVYWDRYYHDRPWYRDWSRPPYVRPHHFKRVPHPGPRLRRH